MGEHTYLIRYGVMSQVGRFIAPAECDAPFERGQVVVIQSHRGTELGEVLIRHDIPVPAQTGWEARPAGEDSTSAQEIEQPRVLRLAGPEDLTRSERAQQARPSRFMLCQRVLDEGNWPWELIDVEPLLDDRTTVLHYLGPHRLDVASLRARFRMACDLDVVLEPAGSDDGAFSHEGVQHGGGEGGCGSCDCGEGGGCGSKSTQDEDHGAPTASSGANGRAPKAHGGCASCGIGQLLAARARQKA